MEIFEQIINFIKNLRFYWWFSPMVIGAIWYFFKWLKIQFKFGKNLRREVYFLKTSEKKQLQAQRDQIKNVNLFKINNDIKDISTETKVLQNLNKTSIFIVGYDNDFNYGSLFSHIEQNKIPIIIFAEQGEIKKEEHWKIFNNYIYCDVANTSNRLLIILVNILKII